MTLFLRNRDGKTLVDIELYTKTDGSYSYVEVSSSINIENYSLLLLDTIKNHQYEIIGLFDELSELRGWLWEVYFCSTKNTKAEYANVLAELRKYLRKIAHDYDLQYVED